MRSMRTFKNLFFLMLMALVMFVAVGCGGSKIELSFEEETYTVEVGKDIPLTPTVKNEDEEEYKLVFSSEDDAVVTYVDGKIKGIAVGETKVKVELDGNDKIFAEVTVKVVAAKKFKVTFNVDGGSAIAEVEVTDGGKVAKPGDPTKPGFVFAGWYTSTAKTTVYDFNAAVTAAMTLYAKWDVAEYDVTFDVDGGSEVAAVGVNHGGKVAKPDDPTKENHQFLGWFSDEALTTEYDFDTEVTSNITLYAKWALNTYQVTFNVDGGSAIAQLTVDHGAKAVKPADPTKTNYVFKGWYKEAAFTTEFNFETEVVTAAITIYAKWEYDMTGKVSTEFELNGGSFSIFESNFFIKEAKVSSHALAIYNNPDLYMKKYQTSIFLFDTTLSLKGTGWAHKTGLKRNADGLYEVMEQVGGSSTSSDDLTRFDMVLLAHDGYPAGYAYIRSLTVGQVIAITGIDSATVVPGEVTGTINAYPAGSGKVSPAIVADKAKLPTPTKADKVFVGWYTTADFTGEAVTEAFNGKVYAKWEDKVYTITYDIEVPGETQKIEYTVNSEEIVLPIPTKTDHNFIGWYKNAEFTGEAVVKVPTGSRGDLKLFAKFEIIKYDAVFETNGGSAIATAKVDINTKLAMPTSPTRTGFAFNGWFADEALTTPFDFETVFTENHTLYAAWIEMSVAEVDYAAVYNETRGTYYIKVTAVVALDTTTIKSIHTYMEAGQVLAEPVELTVLEGDPYLWFGVAKGDASLELKAEGVYAYWVVTQTDEVYVFSFDYKRANVTGLPSIKGATIDYAALYNEVRKTWYIKVTVDGELLDADTIKSIRTVKEAGEFVTSTTLTPDTDVASWLLWFGVADELGFPSLKNNGTYAYEVTRNDDSKYVFEFNYDVALITGLPESQAADVDYKAVWNETTQKWYITLAADVDLDAASVKSVSLVKEAGAYITPVELTLDTNKVLTFEVAGVDGLLTLGAAGEYTYRVVRNDDTAFVFGFKFDKSLVTGIMYDVEFVVNGGSAVEVAETEIGTPVVKPADPTREGYTFAGWFADSKLTNAFDFESKVAANIKLYAKWDAIQYTLAYELNEGVYEYPKFTTKTELIEAFLTDFYAYVKPTESLSDFMHGVGKTTGYDGTWHSTHKAKIYSGPRPTVVDEAYFVSSAAYMEKWLPFFDMMDVFVKTVNNAQYFFGAGSSVGLIRLRQYVINVKPASYVTTATMNMMPNAYKLNTNFTIETATFNLPTDLKKEGLVFLGWYNNAEFTGEAITSIAKGSMGNITFYARFAETLPTYDVTFNVNGGSEIAVVNVTHGQKLAMPTEPTKDGYTFAGWFTDEALTSAYNFDKIVTLAKTLYARWVPTVATARAADIDALVTTKGIVTAIIGNNVFIQDATGGIYLYLGGNADYASSLVVGNEVEVSGTRAVYSNLVQLSTITKVVVTKTKQDAPAAVEITDLVLADVLAQEGKLVTINNLTIKSIPTIGTGSYTVVVTNGTVDLDIRVDKYITTFAELKAFFEDAYVGQGINLVNIPVGRYNDNPQVMPSLLTQMALQPLSQELLEGVLETKLNPGTEATADVTLPATVKVSGVDYVVTWTSNNEAVFSNAGVVVRPAAGEADVVVQLTAVVNQGETVTATLVYDVTVKAEVLNVLPQIGTTVTFEAPDYTAGSTYNNVTEAVSGVEGSQWATYYGTPSTTAPLNGLQSMQMRWYTTAVDNLGYTKTNYTVENLKEVKFLAANTNGLNVEVSVSTDGTTWTNAQVFTLTTTSTEYTYTLETATTVYVKFAIKLDVAPTTTSRVYLDDVSFWG